MDRCQMVVIGSSLIRLAKDTAGVEVVSWIEQWHDNLALAEEGEMVFADIETPGLRLDTSLSMLKQACGDRPLLIAMTNDEPHVLGAVSALGVSGILNKPVHRRDLLDAIQVVRAGGSYIDPSEAMQMIEAVTSSNKQITEVSVTIRETEVLTLLAQGLSARQIARRLSLSERTINTHVANLYRKLSVTNRVEAIRAGIRLGVIESP